jgi:hypothetical protein
MSCCVEGSYLYLGYSDAVKEAAQKAGSNFNRVWKRYTDVISSLGILALTTCQLAAKIFAQTPKILPSLANFIYNYCGVIWLNVMVDDFVKYCRDLSRDVQARDFSAILETAAKVVVSSMNIILTCGNFLAAIVTTAGFPHLSMAYYLAMRPFGLMSLAINVTTDLYDYRANQKMIRQLDRMEDEGTVIKVMSCFKEIIVEPSKRKPRDESFREAEKIIRRLKPYVIYGFEERFKKGDNTEKMTQEVARKLFDDVRMGLKATQISTKSNIGLTGLGYFAMGISRAFPQTIADIGSRWSMSLLYSVKLIWEKYKQSQIINS